MLGSNCSVCCCKEIGVAMRNFSGLLRPWNYCGGRLPCPPGFVNPSLRVRTAHRFLHNLTTEWTRFAQDGVSVQSSYNCGAQCWAKISEDGTQVDLRIDLSRTERGVPRSGLAAQIEYSKPMMQYRQELLDKRVTFAQSDAYSVEVFDNSLDGVTVANAAEVVLLVDPVFFDYGTADYELTITGDAVQATDGTVWTDGVYDIAHELSFASAQDFIGDSQGIGNLGGECDTGYVTLEVPLSRLSTNSVSFGAYFGLGFELPAKRENPAICVSVGPIGMKSGGWWIPEINFVAFHQDCVCQFEQLFFRGRAGFMQPGDNLLNVQDTEFSIEMKISPKADATETMPVICGNPLP
jgi:hypothetical protein